MMEQFSAEWLALREPADHAARVRARTAARPAAAPALSRAHAVDLAAGTGSNVRYLMPRLPHVRRWTLVDHDQALLDEAQRQLEPLARAWGCEVHGLRADLTRLDALPLGDYGLVTASALLDLVSEPWMQTLARRCREAGVDVLCALTFDGRIAWNPVDDDDEQVRVLTNRHQGGDKGFGAALGPGAARMAAACLRAERFTVEATASDWVLEPDTSALQSRLVDGWTLAAREMAPAAAEVIDAWRTRRLAHVAAGRSHLRVGHQDLAAWLTAGHA
jgi:hypothetical protein